MIKDQKGQIMIESIIAITIGVVALTGVLNLLTGSLGINRDVGQRFTATYLAMEGVEITKSLINSNYSAGCPWNQGLSSGSYEFEYNTSFTNRNCANRANDLNDERLSGDPKTIYFDNGTGLYSYDTTGEETRFTRVISIDSLRSGDEVRVTSEVSWEEGNNNRQISIEDHFFDWRP